MASAGASSCCRAMLTLRFELTSNSCRVIGVPKTPGAKTIGQARNFSSFCRNETWCRRWWNISRRGLSTGTRTFAPSLSPILSKEQQHYKEARETREIKEPRESKEIKSSKETKESKKTKDKSVEIMPPEVEIQYLRGLPRIVLPLPSRPEKCMFTLRPITQTVGDFLDMLKLEDPAIVEAYITSTDGIKLGVSNRLETIFLDNFNLVINGKIYPVAPPLHIEHPKENLQQLRDIKALLCQAYETFNAREYHAELEQRVMAQLEEVRIELEPLEQQRIEIENAAARRSHLASWGVLVMMSMQFGCLARLTWWEYSWDIMEPVTYFVTYATAMGCYIYFLMTKQEYMLPEVFRREHLIGVHKKAKKLGFDLERYNILKEEAHELETMLKLIRGPLHLQETVIEQKRRLRLQKLQETSSIRDSSSSSSSRSPSSSPSPTPERTIGKSNDIKKKDDNKASAKDDKNDSTSKKSSSAVIKN